MYIFEIIVKLIRNLREKRKISHKIKTDYIEETQDDCVNHIYFPIDSTKKYLACKNCGHLIKNEKF